MASYRIDIDTDNPDAPGILRRVVESSLLGGIDIDARGHHHDALVRVYDLDSDQQIWALDLDGADNNVAMGGMLRLPHECDPPRDPWAARKGRIWECSGCGQCWRGTDVWEWRRARIATWRRRRQRRAMA